jgi:endonuclease/exonuclease/phosphatase family metal-dependent hydrolase
VPPVLTQNVRRCPGTVGRLSPGRIADVISSYEPDVVALQELNVRRARTGGVDQAHAIAKALGVQMHFHASQRLTEEEYGNAILTHRPSQPIEAEPLPDRTGCLAPNQGRRSGRRPAFAEQTSR